MKIKGLVDEDFVNYRLPSMFIIAPSCSFKCEKESKSHCCQNGELAQREITELDDDAIIRRFVENPITDAVVFGGLEPMDSFDEVYSFIRKLRTEYCCECDVVIYTGYTVEECREEAWLDKLASLRNVVIKFGRYIPSDKPHYDPTLGVNLASRNQYAIRL